MMQKRYIGETKAEQKGVTEHGESRQAILANSLDNFGYKNLRFGKIDQNVIAQRLAQRKEKLTKNLAK